MYVSINKLVINYRSINYLFACQQDHAQKDKLQPAVRKYKYTKQYISRIVLLLKQMHQIVLHFYFNILQCSY